MYHRILCPLTNKMSFVHTTSNLSRQWKKLNFNFLPNQSTETSRVLFSFACKLFVAFFSNFIWKAYFRPFFGLFCWVGRNHPTLLQLTLFEIGNLGNQFLSARVIKKSTKSLDACKGKGNPLIGWWDFRSGVTLSSPAWRSFSGEQR